MLRLLCVHLPALCVPSEASAPTAPASVCVCVCSCVCCVCCVCQCVCAFLGLCLRSPVRLRLQVQLHVLCAYASATAVWAVSVSTCMLCASACAPACSVHFASAGSVSVSAYVALVCICHWRLPVCQGLCGHAPRALTCTQVYQSKHTTTYKHGTLPRASKNHSTRAGAVEYVAICKRAKGAATLLKSSCPGQNKEEGTDSDVRQLRVHLRASAGGKSSWRTKHIITCIGVRKRVQDNAHNCVWQLCRLATFATRHSNTAKSQRTTAVIHAPLGSSLLLPPNGTCSAKHTTPANPQKENSSCALVSTTACNTRADTQAVTLNA